MKLALFLSVHKSVTHSHSVQSLPLSLLPLSQNVVSVLQQNGWYIVGALVFILILYRQFR